MARPRDAGSFTRYSFNGGNKGIRLANETIMCGTTADAGRQQLRFTEAVLSAFEFLDKEFGFSVKRIEPTFVRYESPDLFVNVYHGRSSYVLGFEVGRLNGAIEEKERAFSIEDISELSAIRGETSRVSFQASTAQFHHHPCLVNCLNVTPLDKLALSIYFDDGPHYEFNCLSFKVDQGSGNARTLVKRKTLECGGPTPLC